MHKSDLASSLRAFVHTHIYIRLTAVVVDVLKRTTHTYIYIYRVILN